MPRLARLPRLPRLPAWTWAWPRRSWRLSPVRLGSVRPGSVHLSPARLFIAALLLVMGLGSMAQAARLDDELLARDRTHQMPDLRPYPAGNQRKVAFFELMIPLVVAENQRIAEQRDWLLAMRKRAGDGGRDYSEREQERLNGLCDQVNLPCDVTREDIGVSWTRLLLRIDTLPLDMVLVQAIEESGWGRRVMPVRPTICSACVASRAAAVSGRWGVNIGASRAWRRVSPPISTISIPSAATPSYVSCAGVCATRASRCAPKTSSRR